MPTDADLAKLDDASLLLQIARGNQAALSTLYDRYAQGVYAIAIKSLRSVEESEEVVLDVFAQIWRTGASYDPTRGRVDSWLFLIARSRILDRLRKRQRVAKRTQASIEAEIQTPKLSVDPIEGIAKLERQEQVAAALNQLPIEQRQMIELAYYQGLTHREIAAQTGLSLGTVKTRIRLGLQKLRGSLHP